MKIKVPSFLSVGPNVPAFLNRLALASVLATSVFTNAACGTNEEKQFGDSGAFAEGDSTGGGTDTNGESASGDSTSGAETMGNDSSDSTGESSTDETGVKFDVSPQEDIPPDWECVETEIIPCDADIPITDAPPDAGMILGALGICNDEFYLPPFPGNNQVYPGAAKVIDKMGDSGLWIPEQGFNRMLALSTGWVNSMLDVNGNVGDFFQNPLDPNDPYLPHDFTSPYERNLLGEEAVCPEDAGNGDCSNSLFETVIDPQGNEISVDFRDFSFITLHGEVPADKNAVIVDFSFHSLEDIKEVHAFNDTFSAYLVVENDQGEMIWTGNIAFNQNQKPITVAGLNGAVDHLPGPDYVGTRLESFPVGGGTNWLQAIAPVPPGSKIKLRLSIGDVGDVDVNSILLVRQVSYGCTSKEAPVTEPVG